MQILLEVRRVKDNRYCSGCKQSQDIYEIFAQYSYEDVTVQKSITLCKHCLEKIQNVDLNKLQPYQSSVIVQD